jgi:membrane-bound lytic murein transglycosylase B
VPERILVNEVVEIPMLHLNSKKFLFSHIIPYLFFTLSLAIVFIPTARVGALTQEEQQAEWRAELAQTEADIAKWQNILDTTKKGTASLQRDADALNAKIQQAKLFIKQKNIAIAKLGQDIIVKAKHISSLQNQINQGHESMAQLLRKTNELDEFGIVNVVLANKNLSDFFSDVDTIQTINRSLDDLFVQVRANKNLTEKEKSALDAQKVKETDTKVAKQIEQKQVEQNEQEKQYLIQVNKTQEKTYAEVLSEKQAKAAQIRAKLFNLAGGGAAIPFGDALTYAQTSSSQTGVDPAFLLAILTQESNLGANVGKCYLTDTTSGYGVSASGNKVWSNLMKPGRDITPFLDITSKLGLDPLKTVVSCPIPSAGGYGGAMGPAQFIPSTWVLLTDRLKNTLGHDANPWAPQDAFTASAMYLSDLGASGTSYSSQIKAACRYYGTRGTTCAYGRSVMNLKTSIQSDIDYLNQYGISRR